MRPSKMCVVAGVGKGMGLAIAKRFAKEGYNLALIARDPEVLERFAAELRALGVSARGFPTDLCRIPDVRQTFETIGAAFGPTDILVYNAARWHEVAAMAIDPATFHDDLALSVTGALVCAQAVYPSMKLAGHGTMLFTGGGLALSPHYGTGVSSLTAGKSGLRGLVHAMAGELSADGIHVATVTIAGTVREGTAFDPDRIAEHYVDLHKEDRGHWTTEKIVNG